MLNNPLEQFKLKVIYRIHNKYIDLSLTNSSIIIILSILFIIILNSNHNKIINNKWDILIEKIYIKINIIVKEMIGINKYTPLIYSLFLFILINNVIGLIPYSFTTTSHLVINLTLSLSIIIGITLIGLYKHSYKFFNLFIPSGLSKGPTKFLIPLIFLIEFISYLSRIISLSVRLTANMLSGHIMLNLIASFGYKLVLSIPLLILIPITILFPFILLELGIAFIQSYVFIVLTCAYLKDVEHLH